MASQKPQLNDIFAMRRSLVQNISSHVLSNNRPESSEEPLGAEDLKKGSKEIMKLFLPSSQSNEDSDDEFAEVSIPPPKLLNFTPETNVVTRDLTLDDNTIQISEKVPLSFLEELTSKLSQRNSRKNDSAVEAEETPNSNNVPANVRLRSTSSKVVTNTQRRHSAAGDSRFRRHEKDTMQILESAAEMSFESENVNNDSDSDTSHGASGMRVRKRSNLRRSKSSLELTDSNNCRSIPVSTSTSPRRRTSVAVSETQRLPTPPPKPRQKMYSTTNNLEAKNEISQCTPKKKPAVPLKPNYARSGCDNDHTEIIFGTNSQIKKPVRPPPSPTFPIKVTESFTSDGATGRQHTEMDDCRSCSVSTSSSPRRTSVAVSDSQRLPTPPPKPRQKKYSTTNNLEATNEKQITSQCKPPRPPPPPTLPIKVTESFASNAATDRQHTEMEDQYTERDNNDQYENAGARTQSENSKSVPTNLLAEIRSFNRDKMCQRKSAIVICEKH